VTFRGGGPGGRIRAVRNSGAQLFLYVFAGVIALVGLADSIYLAVLHLTGQTADCIASSGCETVLGSSYAQVGKVPLAGFGAAGYFTLFSLATLAAFEYTSAKRLFPWMVAMMLAVTLWLLYVQAFVLHAFCDFCLLSASLIGVLSGICFALFFLARKVRP
jgi:uncharacterized membrane protein